MFVPQHLRTAFFGASLLVPTLFLNGCSGDGAVATDAVPMAKGNWQISSAAGSAARLPVLSGEFNTQAGTITGILHSQSAAACVAPGASFVVSGSADANQVVTLSGAVAGGSLSVSGTLAADGKSLTEASYKVSGGSCGFTQPAPAIAQNFAPVTGTYTGNFSDADGQLAQVSADFSQSSTPDANGDFTLAGTATISGNPSFPSSVPISNTQVTGGTFSFTYADSGCSVTASGTFAPDASTLTVTGWTASGPCGSDTGTQSVMTKH